VVDLNVAQQSESAEDPRSGGNPVSRESQATRLVRLFLRRNPTLFHDQYQVPHVRVSVNGARVTLPVNDRKLKVLLAQLLWEAEGTAPSGASVRAAINVLTAKALYEGAQHALHVRVAPDDDGIWIDMADARWRAIHVTDRGWMIVDDPPILFRRYSHMQPLGEPTRGGDPWRLLTFLNIPAYDADTRLLLLCTVASYLIPEIPHPILVVYGTQGSAKTMLMKLIRSLIDPSSVELLSIPRGETERVQQLAHHWLAFYDNLTRVDAWMSDAFCRAATGGGFTKRKLYSDDADVIYTYRRCIGLNGINVAAQRGDLLDRSLLVELRAIPDAARRTERDLLDAFDAVKPEILGGFLDVLVAALPRYQSTQVHATSRMADYARWGCVIAQALGSTQNAFLAAYARKNRLQIEEAAHSSPIATALLAFMHARGAAWRGTPTDLYIALNGCARAIGISTQQRAWPKAPHVLVRYLNELTPALAQLGLKCETGRHTGTRREVMIRPICVTRVTDAVEISRPNDTNATNASSPTLHVPTT
jgi:hypothetical protein